MIKKLFPILALVLALSWNDPRAWAGETSDVLPGGLAVGIFVRMHASDPGIQWILDSYKRNFLLDHMGDQAQAVVEDFSLVELKDASVAFFDAFGASPKMLLVSDMIPTDASITFKVKNVDFKLKIKERSAEKGLQPAIVKALLGAWVSAPDRTFLDHDMAYSASLEKTGRMCAYAVSGRRIIVANDLSMAQDALQSTLSGNPANPTPTLKEFLRRFKKPQDFLVYLDNQTGFLKQYNDLLEKKLQIPLLTAVDSLRCAGIFVDIVDKNRIELRGIFLLDNPGDVSATKQDLNFLVEFFRRKLLAQGIRSVAHLNVSQDRVQVRMTLRDTSEFLTRFLKKGRIKKTRKT